MRSPFSVALSRPASWKCNRLEETLKGETDRILPPWIPAMANRITTDSFVLCTRVVRWCWRRIPSSPSKRKGKKKRVDRIDRVGLIDRSMAVNGDVETAVMFGENNVWPAEPRSKDRTHRYPFIASRADHRSSAQIRNGDDLTQSSKARCNEKQTTPRIKTECSLNSNRPKENTYRNRITRYRFHLWPTRASNTLHDLGD